jgi:hypothetical protein
MTALDGFLEFDLGGAQEGTALAVLSHDGAVDPPAYAVRHLQLWRPGTPYWAIPADMAALRQTPGCSANPIWCQQQDKIPLNVRSIRLRERTDCHSPEVVFNRVTSAENPYPCHEKAWKSCPIERPRTLIHTG